MFLAIQIRSLNTTKAISTNFSIVNGDFPQSEQYREHLPLWLIRIHETNGWERVHSSLSRCSYFITLPGCKNSEK